MILIAIGANLASDRFGSPIETCEAALAALDSVDGVRLVRRSRWFESAPVPISDQPWYVNGACVVESDLDAKSLLAALHAIEADFGRVRTAKNAARILDLDLLIYHDFISTDQDHMNVPHPRMHERAFVLLPLKDLVPGWCHPVTGASLDELIANLSPDQIIRPKEETHTPDEFALDMEFDGD